LARARQEGESKDIDYFMRTLWFFVYWGTIMSGTVLNQFFKRYWSSGHFSKVRKAKFALK